MFLSNEYGVDKDEYVNESFQESFWWWEWSKRTLRNMTFEPRTELIVGYDERHSLQRQQYEHVLAEVSNVNCWQN